MLPVELPRVVLSPSRVPIAAPLDARRRLHMAYAATTVGLPTLGAVAAVGSAWHFGVSSVEWLLFGVMYAATALGIEAGFHRYFSHHAFRGTRFVTYLLGALGSMAGQGPVLFWAAIHRNHHACSDGPGDPHSPWQGAAASSNPLSKLFHAHVGWLFHVDRTDWARFTPDLIRDRDVMRNNSLYPLWLLLGLAIPAAIGGLTLGVHGIWRGLVWGGLLRAFALDHVTWAVNSFGHVFGRRPYVSKDRSGNIALLALPSFGGSWHNNHHAFPASARNDHRFYQLDLSGLFIEGLARLGLASDVHRPKRLERRQQGRKENHGPSAAI